MNSAMPKKKNALPFAELVASLNVPEHVRLAAVLAVELRTCELHDDVVGAVSCRAAYDIIAVGTSHVVPFQQIVLGYLLIHGRPLSELCGLCVL